MKLLAIDTVTEACSVALLHDGGILERYEVTPRGHSQRVLPMAGELLEEAGLAAARLDAIVVDRGPGSFTGVRIGISVAQGLAFALDLPVIAISSLAALAQAAYQQQGHEKVLSVIDARMGEVYWGYYRFTHGRMCLLDDEAVSPVESITRQAGDWLAVGSGCGTYRDAFSSLAGVQCPDHEEDPFPRAASLLELARFDWAEKKLLSAEQAQPVYLRNKVAKKPKL